MWFRSCNEIILHVKIQLENSSVSVITSDHVTLKVHEEAAWQAHSNKHQLFLSHDGTLQHQCYIIIIGIF